MSADNPEGQPNVSSIINVGDLSKPATVLIEKISDAVTGLFRPKQIIRAAKAEAKAKIIQAETDVQISDLHRRALGRLIEEEAVRQRNMEEITRQALPQLHDRAKPEAMSDDWIANFFDKCRNVSDREMQDLWARVLAGEANTPGSYSKRTVNFLTTLDSEEAELFACFSYLLWQDSNGGYFILESSAIHQFWKFKLHFRAAEHHLQNIGLVDANTLNYPVSQLLKWEFRYLDETFRFTPSAPAPAPATRRFLEPIELIAGVTYLTAAGNQLLGLIERKKFAGYAEAIMKQQAAELKLGYERVIASEPEQPS
ncbi:MAG: hypothetical protein DMF28_00740 [Verrucomicrobia bacterium]|nr:MAG: hypothetical protein DMF28_00740 [Verrucomicrobiota bacterium]